MTVPNGATDTATFETSNVTDISFSGDTIVDGITFVPGSSAFTIRVYGTTADPVHTLRSVTLYGTGITNNSGRTQQFVISGWSYFPDNDPMFGTSAQLVFRNSATAGSSTVFDNSGYGYATSGIGTTIFTDTSSADHGSFINEGAHEGQPGATQFFNSSTAANGTFTNYSPYSDGGEARGGFTAFYDSSTADHATITNNGIENPDGAGATSYTVFSDTSTADAATLIANTGLGYGGAGIIFKDQSSGGTSKVEVLAPLPIILAAI